MIRHIEVGGDKEPVAGCFSRQNHLTVLPGAYNNGIAGSIGKVQLIMHIRRALMEAYPPGDLLNRGAFMHNLHAIMMVVFPIDRNALTVRIDIHPWQTVGIVSQTLLIYPLLRIIRFANPDNSVPGGVAGLNPVVRIRIDKVIIPAKKDTIPL